MHFLHSYSPSPILLHWNFLTVRWYGLLMVVAIASGLFVTLRLARQYGISKERVYDLAFYLVIASIIGARIYAVLLFPKYYVERPLEIFQVWKGGLAIHGAIFAGILTLWWYTKKKKISFWLFADILAPALTLGQVIGRWGNYFNQELFGTPTSLPWGIPIDLANRPAGFENFEFFHPTFLYESILNLLVFFVLLAFHALRLKKKESKNKNQESGNVITYKLVPTSWYLQAGNITLLYLILYSLIRIFMEQFRIDETPMLFEIRLPILVSISIIIVAIVLFSRLKKK